MLAWNPQVGDLAAQVFRTELFQRGGLAIWNGSWYGGHYTLTYSVLFPPLAALLGPQTVGALAVIASSYLFDRLVRDRWGEAARWATLWFAAGVVTLLADGQLTFALGVAFGLADAARAAASAAAGPPPLGRPPAARSPARSPPPSSPASSSSARSSAAAPLEPRRAIWVACDRARPGPDPQPRLPRSRASSPSAFSSYVAIPLWCGSALYITRGLAGEERQLRWVLAGYLLAATARLAGAQRDGRQRGPARRPVRRPGPGRGRARPPPPGLRSGSSRSSSPAASTGR